MATGESNAAKKQDDAPQLEVVENSAEVMSAADIDALLNELAAQNTAEAPPVDTSPTDAAPAAESHGAISEDELAQAMAEAANAPVDDDPYASFEEEDSPEVEVVKSLSAEPMEPEVEIPVALEVVESDPEPEPATTLIQTNVTMEDVLRAATESTSFSREEILEYQRPAEDEEADVVQPTDPEEDFSEFEGLHGSMGLGSDETVSIPLGDAAPQKMPEKVKAPKAPKAERKPIKIALPSLSFGGLGAKIPSIVGAALVVGGFVGMFFFVKSSTASLEKKLVARQAKTDETVSDIESIMKGQTEQLARIEEAIVGSGGRPKSMAHPATSHEPTNKDSQTAPPHSTAPDDHGAKPEPEHKATPEAAHGKPVDTHAPVKSSDHGAAKAESHGSAKPDAHKPAAKPEASHAPAKTSTSHKNVPGTEGFHFSGNALKVSAPGHKVVESGGRKIVLSTKSSHGAATHKSPSASKSHGSKKSHKPAHRSVKPAAKSGNSVKVYLDGKPVSGSSGTSKPGAAHH